MNNNIDSEWDNFLEYNLIDNIDNNIDNIDNIDNSDNSDDSNNYNDFTNIKCSDLYISTKTKIVYINKNIDIYDIFWKIPIIKYYKQEEGIIKKQIKVSLKNEEDSFKLDEIIKNIDCYKTINVLNFINNPKGRIVYKDIRKITIGLSKKDLLFNKNTNKSAFYNCFVLTMRLLDETIFKEFHIKVFNTGKIEIPGIQNDNIVYKILNNLVILLKKIAISTLYIIKVIYKMY